MIDLRNSISRSRKIEFEDATIEFGWSETEASYWAEILTAQRPLQGESAIRGNAKVIILGLDGLVKYESVDGLTEAINRALMRYRQMFNLPLPQSTFRPNPIDRLLATRAVFPADQLEIFQLSLETHRTLIFNRPVS